MDMDRIGESNFVWNIIRLKKLASQRGYNPSMEIDIVGDYREHLRCGCSDIEAYNKTREDYNI